LAAQSVLVIDDEAQIRRVVRNVFADADTVVLEASTGAEGVTLAAAQRPALILLDLGLPDIAGIDVCRDIRKWSDVPIIVLSARHLDTEKATLLNAGADDYVTKPFSTVELKARVNALLRRARNSMPDDAEVKIPSADIVIDLAKPAIRRAGKDVHLTKTEWDVLRALLKHAGRTLTHRQIFAAVWAHSYGDAQQYLRVHIRSLRKKLEVDSVRPRLIVTEPGVGYRIETDN
jgi:two-component system KDP operon response regulator KdpE